MTVRKIIDTTWNLAALLAGLVVALFVMVFYICLVSVIVLWALFFIALFTAKISAIAAVALPWLGLGAFACSMVIFLGLGLHGVVGILRS